MFKPLLLPTPSVAAKKRSKEPLWVFKANPYRDGNNGQFTSQEKASYQGAKLFEMTSAFAKMTESQKASFYVQTPLGKKAVAEFANEFVKFKKNLELSGNTSPPTVTQFLKAQVSSFEDVDALEQKIAASLSAKKAWVKIYQKKSLDALEKEYPELAAAFNSQTNGSMAQLKAQEKMAKKVAAWKDQYESNGGDPAVFSAALQKAAAKASPAMAGLFDDEVPAPAPVSPSAPKFKTFSTPDSKGTALFANADLGNQYYTLADKNGKNSPEAQAAYSEWQKAKDHLTANGYIEPGKMGELSLKIKQAAAQLIAADKAKDTAEQALAKQTLDKTMGKLGVMAQASYSQSLNDPSGKSGAGASYAAILDKLENEALEAGASFAQINALKSKAKEIADSQAKSAAQVENLLKGGTKAVLDYYDAPGRTFHDLYDTQVPDGYMQHANDTVKALTSAQKTSLQHYTGSGYKEQNKSTVGTLDAGYSTVTDVQNISQAMAKSTLGFDLKLRRNAAQRWFWQGLGTSIADVDSLSASELSQFEGRTYTEKAFSSTSKNLSFNSAFSSEASNTGAIRMNIRASKTTRGIDLSQGVSSHAGEQEVLLDRGVTYLIRKVKRTSSGQFKYTVDVDVIGHV